MILSFANDLALEKLYSDRFSAYRRIVCSAWARCVSSSICEDQLWFLYVMIQGVLKKRNPTLACHCALITECMNVMFA